MITRENIHTLGDLLENAAVDFENQVFIRYETDGIVYEKGYRTFAMDTRAVAHWTINKMGELGKKPHVALIGKCSYEYLTVLMGVAAAGGVAIPLDVQLSKEGFIENLKRAEADVVFFDYEYLSDVEYLEEACDCIQETICIQQRRQHFSTPQIHREFRVPTITYYAQPEDCALVIFTSGTTGHGKGVMLSHGNLLDNMFSSDDARETCLSVLPIHHVFCISGDLLLNLRYGSTLCLCDDITKFLYYIDLFQPTMMRIVPMMANSGNLYQVDYDILSDKAQDKVLYKIVFTPHAKVKAPIVRGVIYVDADTYRIQKYEGEILNYYIIDKQGKHYDMKESFSVTYTYRRGFTEVQSVSTEGAYSKKGISVNINSTLVNVGLKYYEGKKKLGASYILKNKISSLEQEVSSLRSRIAQNQGASGADKDSFGHTLTRTLSQFEQLNIEYQFAQKVLEAALNNLETTRQMSLNKSKYLVTIDNPKIPDESLWPRPFLATIVTFIVTLFLLSAVSLLISAIKEHLGI